MKIFIDDNDEKELFAKIVNDDEIAFSIFYNRYYRKIYSFILKYVHTEELSQDLTQELFVKIWNGRSKLADVDSISSYLFVMCKNHALNSLKRKINSDQFMAELIRVYPVASNCLEDSIQYNEYNSFIKAKLAQLPLRSQNIFMLCRQEGQSYQEVAAAMGISKNAVKNHMVFTMKTLRASLQKSFDISISILLIATFSFLTI